MKLTLTILLLCFLSVIHAADSTKINAGSNLKLGVGYAPGFITENTLTSQLHANLGYEINGLSVRFDTYYFLDSKGDRPRFTFNHQFYLGSFYRFGSKKLHPSIGAQIGLAYAQSNENGVFNAVTGIIDYKPAINPVALVSLGIEYDFTKQLYTFFEGKYISGKHVSNSYPTYLDELRISIGIGFNLINKTTN